ncbi:hypothetical protein [Psychrobacter urativorans]|uniref:hypothetical protein n=1 Tax=Psychrobacter urativorans TaxID=45610 RepID=UPI00191B88DF|nr:hypothetical protein [Psychrobacter urativorans]
MWNKPLQTLAVSIMMAAGVSLSACDGSKQNTVEEVASDISGEQSAAPVQGSPALDGDLDGATVEQGVPVSYDVSAWGKDSVDSLNVDELDKIKSTFGKVLSTDENSLDYTSSPATKYRFMDTDEPYLDLIDSKKYLELGWYYANPTDTDKEKDLSRSHAEKAYKLARQLMGDEGGKVLADILGGQIIKNKSTGNQKIELAKCEFYSCMLILNKSGVKVEESGVTAE